FENPVELLDQLLPQLLLIPLGLIGQLPRARDLCLGSLPVLSSLLSSNFRFSACFIGFGPVSLGFRSITLSLGFRLSPLRLGTGAPLGFQPLLLFGRRLLTSCLIRGSLRLVGSSFCLSLAFCGIGAFLRQSRFFLAL